MDMDRNEVDASGQRIYDAMRERYGANDPRAWGYCFNRWFERERELVLNAVGGGSGTILDVGCGSGLMTAPLARAGRRVIGVDLNRAGCEQARRNGLQAVRGDATALPLADATADVVVNVHMVQQCSADDAERVLRETARVLRAGGRLIIAWANRKAWVHRANVIRLRVLGRERHSDSDIIHHPPARMRAAAERAGLELAEWFSIVPPWGMRLRGVGGPLAALIGSSFIAVFHKGSGAGP